MMAVTKKAATVARKRPSFTQIPLPPTLTQNERRNQMANDKKPPKDKDDKDEAPPIETEGGGNGPPPCPDCDDD